MKKLLLIFTLLCGNAVAQCNGAQSFTLTPLPVGNQYLPGQVVTMCYTMTGYSQAGTNWIEGFDLTLGPGWSNVQPATAPANCGGNTSGGQWIWTLAANTPVFRIVHMDILCHTYSSTDLYSTKLSNCSYSRIGWIMG